MITTKVVKLSDADKIIKEYESQGYRFICSIQYFENVRLLFEKIEIPIENNMTDIKFHIGDFVEDRSGKIGYISDICHCDEFL